MKVRSLDPGRQATSHVSKTARHGAPTSRLIPSEPGHPALTQEISNRKLQLPPEEPPPRPEPLPDLETELDRFHEMIENLAENISSGSEYLGGMTAERLLQGPLADAMTHAGQLAMLRRLSGDPVRPENFILAEIDSGCLGKDQPAPVSPDEVWPEAPKAGHKV